VWWKHVRKRNARHVNLVAAAVMVEVVGAMMAAEAVVVEIATVETAVIVGEAKAAGIAISAVKRR
jgi:hypothetical protein